MTMPHEPSGLARSAVEVERATGERHADLRLERWLLVREVVILVSVVAIVLSLRSVTV